MAVSDKLPVPSIQKYMEHPGDPPTDFRQWFRLFERFLIMINANRTDQNQLTASHKNTYLLMMLGTEGARIFNTNPASDQIDTMGYTQFSEAVKKQFSPKVNIMKACFDFNKRDQLSHKTFDEYLTVLRHMAVDCAFGEQTDRNLAIRLVCGCQDAEIKKRLLVLKEPDLQQVIAIMESEESARDDAQHMQKGDYGVKAVHRKPFQQTSSKQDFSFSCYGCGSSTHGFKSVRCPARDKICQNCKSKGHFASVCKKKIENYRQQKSYTNHRENLSNKFQNKPKVMHKNLNAESIEPFFDPDAALQKVQCGSSQIIASVEMSNGQYFVPIKMEIDTGAGPTTLQRSVYEKHFSHLPLKELQQILSNFDGSIISGNLGVLDTKIRLQGRVHRDNVTIVPDSCNTVLGRNFLTPLGIIIDCGASKVKKVVTYEKSYLQTQFPKLYSPTLGTFGNYQHKIQVNPNAEPTIAKLRPVALNQRENVKSEILKMEKLGIWEKVYKSDWVHPLVVVPKKDTTEVRITTDLSPLNPHITPDVHPIPLVKELFLKLKGAKMFSKLDLRKGYYHIQLDPESRNFTTTITPEGLFQYCRLPMGMKDSASVFQRLVSESLKECPNCLVYIDDILVFGKDKEEHDKCLMQVLKLLNDRDFRLASEKCSFGLNEIPFLGHIIGSDGVKPDPRNLEPILKAAEPTNLKQVMAFLGLINYYHEFLEDLATLAEPLRRLTRKNVPFVWDEQCKLSFETLKKMAAQKLLVFIFNPNAPTTVTTDASDVGIGAVLSQFQNETEVPIAFGSHTLSKSEKNYSVNEKEALACVWACELWEKFLLGRPFTLKTDHSALTSLLSQDKAINCNKRQTSKYYRWRERLSIFDFTVVYKAGAENKVADALSRLKSAATSFKVDLPPKMIDDEMVVKNVQQMKLIEETQTDKELQEVVKYIEIGWPHKNLISSHMKPYFQLRKSLTFKEGLLYKNEVQIVVPRSMQKTVLLAAHEGHPGIVRMKKSVREIYWWPHVNDAVEATVKYCQPCQASVKSTRKIRPVTTTIEPKGGPGEHYGIDISGPFCNGKFVVVLIDYFSRYPELLVTETVTSGRIIVWLKEIFARYGNPNFLTSDNGPQFVSNEFESFLSDRDIIHWKTAVYNPQENGLVENFNRTLKHGIQAILAEKRQFSDGLNDLLLQVRASTQKTTGKSAAELFLGRKIRPSFKPNPRVTKNKTPNVPKLVKPDFQRKKILKKAYFKVGDWVVTKKPQVAKGLSPYSHPKKVSEVLGYYTFRLNDGTKWNARKLKRYYPPETEIWYPPDTDGQVVNHPLRRSTRVNFGRPPNRFQLIQGEIVDMSA